MTATSDPGDPAGPDAYATETSDTASSPPNHPAAVTVHGQPVYGCDVDAETRCGHWHGANDVIAIRFHCCNRWYPCFTCHEESAGHSASVWPAAQHNHQAILCGVCGHQLTIAEYFGCDSTCTKCQAAFNPGCANHYHLYFASD